MTDPLKTAEPRSVLVFSGHMIDARNSRSASFPPENENIAANAIETALDEFGVIPSDLGITQGACGGDLLFAESMLRRGARVELRLPVEEEIFLRDSVAYEKSSSSVPDRWRERYFAVRRHPRVRVRCMAVELEPQPGNPEVYNRCNLWMLNGALAHGARKVRFLCLWNGEISVRLGDTYYLIREVRRRGGKVRWLDTGKLWRLPSAIQLTLPDATY